ncbi:hypothetical protein [Methylocella sp.]|uniref:hypothetical protein n=1 Tax=Methylocella sp. TaxID=1978226 RepID=UPI0035B16D07
MGEPASKRQPLIDLYDFERRMRAGAPAAGAEPAAAPIGGDFAEIEAALLRAASGFDPAAALADADAPREPREAAQDPRSGLTSDLPDAAPIELRASRAQDDDDDFAAAPFAAVPFADDAAPVDAFDGGFSPLRGHTLGVDAFDEPLLRQAASDHFVYVDDAAVAGEAGLYEEKRSRLPLYIMATVAIAGAVGMIASTAFKREAPDSAALMANVSSEAQAPAQTAAAPQAETPAEPAAPAPQQAAEAAPPAVAPHDEARAEAPAAAVAPVVAAPAVAAASLLAPPPYGAPDGAPVALTPSTPEPKLVKTAAVRPDGAIVKPAVHAAAEPVKPEAARPAAKPVKTAALPPPRPAQIASAEKPAKAARAHDAARAEARARSAQPAPAAAEPAPAPVEQAAAPEIAPTTPKPAPLAFVDNAVSSITGATSKIFDWGRTTAANLAHN